LFARQGFTEIITIDVHCRSEVNESKLGVAFAVCVNLERAKRIEVANKGSAPGTPALSKHSTTGTYKNSCTVVWHMRPVKFQLNSKCGVSQTPSGITIVAQKKVCMQDGSAFPISKWLFLVLQYCTTALHRTILS
jgi:hypothetical protein